MKTTKRKSPPRDFSPQMLPYQMQQASAGTGKTFALSSRFLKLLAAGARPDSILAATFTRKGAGEIMDRIMGRLCSAACGDQQARALSDQLGVTLSSRDCLQLVRSMSENLHRLHIGTIDSFFHRVARVMSLELGLPLHWEIVEPAHLAAVRSESLAAMLKDQQVVDLLHLIARGDAERKVATKMMNTVDKTLQLYLQSEESAWKRWQSFDPVSPAEVSQFISKWQALRVSDTRLQSRWQKDLEELAAARWDAVACSTALHNVMNGSNRFGHTPMPNDAVAAYLEMADLVRRAVCHDVGRRTIAALELVARYYRELNQRQLRLGWLQFDDVTRLLASIAERLDDIAHSRLGVRIEHVLLDEFQDTSPDQWHVIAPLVDRVTCAQGRGTFYCVGDKKQAIYAWRGGAPEVFDVVEQRLGDRLVPCAPLIESRRSAPPIMEVVNRVFTNLKNVAEKRPAGAAALAAMAETFPHHRTTLVDRSGYVALERVECSNNGCGQSASQTAEEAVLERVVDEVCRVHREKPDATVGILLRTNAQIARLVHELQLRNVPASEEGGNPLTDSVAVEFMLSALQLCDHPQDGIARFHVSHSPLAEAFQLQPETQKTMQENTWRAHDSAARWRRTLATAGLADTLAQWAAILAPYGSPRDLLRLQQLIEMAESRGNSDVDRPATFVSYVRETKVTEPTTAQIRVMTIHSAKGLEFDVVIAPLFSQRSGWSPKQPELVSRRPKPDQSIDWLCRYVREEEQRFLPDEVRQIFDHAYQVTVRDELCVLYVLLTRAARELRLFVPEGATAGQSSPEGVLLATLAPNLDGVSGVLYESGDANWYSNSTLDHAPTTPDEDLCEFYLPESLPPLRRPTEAASLNQLPVAGAKHVTPSGSASWRRIPRISSQIERYRKLSDGSLIHQCLEQIQWLSDAEWKFIAGEKRTRGGDHLLPAVATVGRRHHLNEVELSELNHRVCEQLRRETATWIFDQSRYLKWVLPRWRSLPEIILQAIRVEVTNEQRLVGRLTDGMLVEGVVDRWITIFEGDKVCAAHVIDFKTDAISAREAERRSRKYLTQLEMYRELVGRYLNLELEFVLGDLFFTQLGTLFAAESLSEKVSRARSGPKNQ